MAAGMTDAVWTMEALLSYGVPHDFHARLDSERSTLLRRPFIHAIEGHHPRAHVTLLIPAVQTGFSLSKSSLETGALIGHGGGEF
jgi:hypothetical protein